MTALHFVAGWEMSPAMPVMRTKIRFGGELVGGESFTFVTRIVTIGNGQSDKIAAASAGIPACAWLLKTRILPGNSWRREP